MESLLPTQQSSIIFDALPREILLHIITLSFANILHLRIVCKNLRSFINRNLIYIIFRLEIAKEIPELGTSETGNFWRTFFRIGLKRFDAQALSRILRRNVIVSELEGFYFDGDSQMNVMELLWNDNLFQSLPKDLTILSFTNTPNFNPRTLLSIPCKLSTLILRGCENISSKHLKTINDRCGFSLRNLDVRGSDLSYILDKDLCHIPSLLTRLSIFTYGDSKQLHQYIPQTLLRFTTNWMIEQHDSSSLTLLPHLTRYTFSDITHVERNGLFPSTLVTLRIADSGRNIFQHIRNQLSTGLKNLRVDFPGYIKPVDIPLSVDFLRVGSLKRILPYMRLPSLSLLEVRYGGSSTFWTPSRFTHLTLPARGSRLYLKDLPTNIKRLSIIYTGYASIKTVVPEDASSSFEATRHHWIDVFAGAVSISGLSIFSLHI